MMNTCPMSPLPEDPVVAMAYIPWQQLNEVYEPMTALKNGTIFPELNKPFMAGGKCCG